MFGGVVEGIGALVVREAAAERFAILEKKMLCDVNFATEE